MAALNLGNVQETGELNVEQLTPLLDDADPEVVRSIVAIIARVGAPAEPALPKLKQIAFEADDAELQTAARQAIASIEAEASTE